jgi:hypothetical protein
MEVLSSRVVQVKEAHSWFPSTIIYEATYSPGEPCTWQDASRLESAELQAFQACIGLWDLE